MPGPCNCAPLPCSCILSAGTGVVVTGAGSIVSPYVIGLDGADTNSIDYVPGNPSTWNLRIDPATGAWVTVGPAGVLWDLCDGLGLFPAGPRWAWARKSSVSTRWATACGPRRPFLASLTGSG